MKRTFKRYDVHLDKLCDIRYGDLRNLKRWLSTILPDTITNLQKQKIHPDNTDTMIEQLGEPGGFDDLLYGDGGGD